jgi:hypothetical protein
VSVRSTLVYAALAALVVAAAAAASVVLLSSTRGDARIGHLSPVAQLRPAPGAPTTTSPAHERHGHDEDDD